MAKVQEVIKWLSNLNPEETIALTGWWVQSDVEHNNGVTLTDDQWDAIAEKHENDTLRHIDEVVEEVLKENN